MRYDMRTLILVSLALLTTSCATTTGVVPIGRDSFMVSIRGSGFSDVGGLKADAFREALSYCEKLGKQFQVVNTSESQPVMAGYPRAEVQFMCLNEGDPELRRAKLERVPTNVTEIRNR